MNSTSHVEDLSSVKKKIKVVVPAERVQQEMERAFQQLQQRVAIAGFRKGKAPLAMVKSQYRADVEKEVSGELIQSSLFEVISDKKLRPVTYPTLEDRQIKIDGALEYAVTVEVKPEIEINGYQKLKLEKKVEPVDQKAIDEVLARIREHHAVLKDKASTQVAENDLVMVTLAVAMDGKNMPEAGMNNQMVELGKQYLLPELETAMPGMALNESKEVAIAFPADHTNKKLAGKTAHFTLTVNGIKEKEMPKLDDQFAASVGEHKSLAELQERIKADLTSERDVMEKRRLEKVAIDDILNANIFEVPSALVHNRFEYLIQQMVRSGIRPQNGEEGKKLEETCYNMAVADIRADLALEAIAKQEKIEIEAKELEEYIEQAIAHEAARQTEMTPEKIAELKTTLSNPENRESIRLRLLSRKTLDFIMSQATIK